MPVPLVRLRRFALRHGLLRRILSADLRRLLPDGTVLLSLLRRRLLIRMRSKLRLVLRRELFVV